MRAYSTLEVVVTNTSVEILYKHRCYVKFAIHDAHVLAAAPMFDVIDWMDALPFDVDKLDVTVTTYERDHMGILRSRNRIATNEQVISPRRITSQSHESVEGISARERDAILTMILDSLIDNPGQSRQDRVQETERIASVLDAKKFAVAGVRAALARGTYGDITNLLDQRERERHHRAHNAIRVIEH